MVVLSGTYPSHNIPYGINSPAFSAKPMGETALAVPSNLSHNVPAAIGAAKTRITSMVKLSLVTESSASSRPLWMLQRRELQHFLEVPLAPTA
jgi:hypothetical protein